MSHPHRSVPLLLLGLLVLLAPGYAKAQPCKATPWSLKDMANSPVLLVGRIISINPPASSARDNARNASKALVEIEVLRAAQPPGTNTAIAPAPTERFKLRLISSYAQAPHCGVPWLRPGQVLLLPLRANAKPKTAPWQFREGIGYYLTTPVTAEMAQPPLQGADPRLFIVQELVNSFRHGQPSELFEAASLMVYEGHYTEPELPQQLAAQIPLDDARWAQILSSLVLAFPGHSLTLAAIQAGEPQQYWTQLQSSFHLAQLALSHLPGRWAAQTMVWQALLADLPGLTDSSSRSRALEWAVKYLTLYRNDALFIETVKAALNQDRSGSSIVALALVDKGQKDCLPEALTRAAKVLARPSADQPDLDAALLLVRRYGSNADRSSLRAAAMVFKKTNPAYAAYLLLPTGGHGWDERGSQ